VLDEPLALEREAARRERGEEFVEEVGEGSVELGRERDRRRQGADTKLPRWT
jgi:hypothetical protein